MAKKIVLEENLEIGETGKSLGYLANNIDKKLTQHEGNLSIDAGATGTLYINIGSTALVNFRMTGSNLEIARLYYLFRTNQYFGNAISLASSSYQNTISKVEVTIGNNSSGYYFTFKNNHASTVRIYYNYLMLS